jgi:V/A-type H+-transporting ATPase subunit A
VYLKSESLDYTYLQQNTFDQIDGATPAERQKLMFSDVVRVLKTAFDFEDKETARKFFLELRQLFTDRNYMALDGAEYRDQSALIEKLISTGSRKDA